MTTQVPSATDYGNTGDISLKGNIPTSTGNTSESSSLGWFYTGAAWAPFGLTDTGNLNITGGSVTGSGASASWNNGAGDLQLLNGLGIDIKSTGTLNVNSGDTTLGGNLTVTGNSEFNGTVDVDADFAVRSGTTDKFFVDNLTGNTTISGDLSISGTASATTFSGAFSGNASSATKLQTARNIGGVSFDGTASIDLPGVNTAGNQDTSGTATQADDINIDEKNDNVSYQVTFSAANNAGYNRQYIDTDNAHLNYNPSTNTLSGLDISATDISADDVSLGDNKFLKFGSSNQLQMYYNAGNSTINHASTGYLILSQSKFHVRSVNSDEVMIEAIANGGVKLFYDSGAWASATPKLETKTGGVEVTGTITATTFGTATQNAYGARTVGTGTPTGGSDGDIYYRY